MRILVVSADGGPVQGPLCAEMADALRDLGHDVTLASRGHLLESLRYLRGQLARRPPDLVIGYNYASILELEGEGDLLSGLDIPNCCYLLDDPLGHYDPRSRRPDFPAHVHALPRISFFCSDLTLGARFAARGDTPVAYLPPGCLRRRCERALHSAPEPRRERDVGAMGNLGNPMRREILSLVAAEPLRLDVHVAAPGSEPLSPGLANALRPPLVRDEDRVRFLRSSAIYLETPSNSAVTGINVKCLNAMACGAFVLMPASPEIDDAFAPEEVATYTSPRDAVEKVRFYLAHEGERRRVAEAGQRAVRERHTLDQRVIELLARLRNRSLRESGRTTAAHRMG